MTCIDCTKRITDNFWNRLRFKARKAQCGTCLRKILVVDLKQAETTSDKRNYWGSLGIIQGQKRQWARDNQRIETLQPWQDGRINNDFVKHYPKESKEMFRPEDMRRAQKGEKVEYRSPRNRDPRELRERGQWEQKRFGKTDLIG